MGNSPRTKKKQLSVRCDCDLAFKQRIEEHAARQDRTVSNYIRHKLKLAMDAEDRADDADSKNL